MSRRTRTVHLPRSRPDSGLRGLGPSGVARGPRARDERGASLILALIFIVVISVITTALTSWVTADLNNTSKFTGAQSIQSAANSATESAL